MNILRSLLCASVFILSSQATLCAQVEPPLEGGYMITKLDGSPIRPGWDITLTVGTIPPTGIRVGIVEVDKADGNGPQEVPSENMVIVRNGGLYVFENGSGNMGTITWNSNKGRFETEMTTGPNAGTKRALK